MRFAIRHAEQFVGLFILTGIVFLVVGLLFIGVNQRWFQRDLEFRTAFTSAEGLRTGLPLELHGFEIGKVKRMRLGPEDRVEVTLSVHREYADRIRPGSVLDLVVQPLGFGASLHLYPAADAGEPLPAGSLLLSTDMPEGRARVARGDVRRPARRDDVAAFLTRLDPLVDRVDATLAAFERLASGLDTQLIGPPGLLDDVARTLRQLDEAVAHSGALLAQAEDRLADLEPDGLLPRLVGAEGTAGRLFQDDGRLYDEFTASAAELAASLAELRALVAYLNGSTPELSALLEEATGALDEGEKVMQGLRNNPLLRGGVAPDPRGFSTFEGYREEVR